MTKTIATIAAMLMLVAVSAGSASASTVPAASRESQNHPTTPVGELTTLPATDKYYIQEISPSGEVTYVDPEQSSVTTSDGSVAQANPAGCIIRAENPFYALEGFASIQAEGIQSCNFPVVQQLNNRVEQYRGLTVWMRRGAGGSTAPVAPTASTQVNALFGCAGSGDQLYRSVAEGSYTLDGLTYVSAPAVSQEIRIFCA